MNKLIPLTPFLRGVPSGKEGTKILCFSIFLWFNTAPAQMFGNEPIERQRMYDVQHIRIEVKLDLQKKTVEGRTTTNIIPLYDTLTMFKVDAVGMDIRRVGFLSPEYRSLFKQAKFNCDKKELSIKLDREYSMKDTITYFVEYTTTNPEKGIYFISPDSLFPNKHYEVWTQGEGEDNRYWFPCYDYPNDKATTETIINLDKKYVTLSNGNLLDAKENPDGTKTWHWSLSKPHVSYLVMIAAGDYDIIRDSYLDVPVNTYVPAGKISMADPGLYLSSDIIKFFSESIGFKYPWEHFGQVGVQDFVYGGMENTGAIVYYDGIYHDERASIDYTSRGLVAHEIAHQWWGDVLTCRNWNEIWLNESFATYFDALYTEHLLGKDEFDYQIMRSGDAAIIADSTVARKPIYTRDGLGVNTYNKGSVVLNMLRTQLGDENFWKAMNLYITENQFQCVTTQNLIDAVNESVENPMLDRKPFDYKWFFNEWIYNAGQPEYKVSYDYDNDTKVLTLNVSQVQRMDSSSIFLTPVPVEIVTEQSRIPTSVASSDLSQSYNIQLDSKPINVIFNKGNKVLCKVYFSKPKEDWLYQVQNSADAIDRITAIKGLRDFLKDEIVINALINSLQDDKFWGVRNEAAAMLGRTNSKFAAENLLKYFSSETDPRVRRTILLSLGGLKHDCSDCMDSKVLSDFISDIIQTTESYYLTADCITAISRFVPKNQLYDLISPLMERDSHFDIIRRAVLSALDSTFDERAVNVFLKYAVIGSTDRVRNTALNQLYLYLDKPGVLDFLHSALTSTRSRSTRFTILNLLEKAKDKSSLPFIQSLISKTYDEELIRKAREVVQIVK
jgi:aminopeptidase N